MTKKSKTIVFFGTEDFSATALRRLLEHHQVDLVITKPDAVRGRGRKIQAPAVKEIALEHDISVLQPQKMDEVAESVKKLNNPLGVLVSYGKIIPQSILDLFPNGIINIHPSLLPKYRGPSPIEATIYNGDEEAGVSLMYLIDKMDAGPVISQASIKTDGTETQITLYDTLAELGSDLMLDFLKDYMSDKEVATSDQDEDQATYTTLLSKDMTAVHTQDMTAAEIERKIRAHLAYPKTSLPLFGEQRIVLKAHIVEEPTETSLGCKDNTWLEVDSLISTSGKAITLADLKNSLANRR